MSIEIELTGKYGLGKKCIMSKCDYDVLHCKKLCMLKAGYVMIWEDNKTQYLHRWIFGLQAGNRNENHVDHINNNKLDCRRENLRVGTRSDNMCNLRHKKDPNSDTYSKYKGVTKRGNKWMVQIQKDGIIYNLGRFNSEIEAGLSYNKKALELHKDYAVLNIITDNDIKIHLLEDMKKTNPELKRFLDKQILFFKDNLYQ